MFLKIILCLVLVTATLGAQAKSEKNFKIYLDTQEFFEVHGDQLITGSAFLNGKVDYKIKKFKIKKSGTEEIATKEQQEGIRNLEVISPSEVKMTLIETGLEVIIPAKIERDEDGIIELIKIDGKDYIKSLNPIQDQMDNTLIKMAKNKILDYLPLQLNVEASDLICTRVENNCCEESEDNNAYLTQLVCTQSHFLKVGM